MFEAQFDDGTHPPGRFPTPLFLVGAPPLPPFFFPPLPLLLPRLCFPAVAHALKIVGNRHVANGHILIERRMSDVGHR